MCCVLLKKKLFDVEGFPTYVYVLYYSLKK